MYNFCTLFDSNYLSRGLSMYESLRKQCADFHLYVFPFDERSYSVLHQMALPGVTLVRQSEFEDPALLAVKPGRTKAEYCWTATSSIILYVIERFNVGHCTYIDADLYFYSSPGVLVEEMGTNSVLITEHRYSPGHRYLAALSGIYCVQFITFKRDDRGLKALRWWRDACLAWCYDRVEDGKFGDQKYLDDWPQRFDGIHVLQHQGGGVAPWNVQQYEFVRRDDAIIGTELKSGAEFNLVFYHYHYVRLYVDGKLDLGDYYLSREVKDLLYRPYLAHLETAKQAIGKIDSSFDPHGRRTGPKGWKLPVINLKRRLYRRYNLYPTREWM